MVGRITKDGRKYSKRVDKLKLTTSEFLREYEEQKAIEASFKTGRRKAVDHPAVQSRSLLFKPIDSPNSPRSFAQSLKDKRSNRPVSPTHLQALFNLSLQYKLWKLEQDDFPPLKSGLKRKGAFLRDEGVIYPPAEPSAVMTSVAEPSIAKMDYRGALIR